MCSANFLSNKIRRYIFYSETMVQKPKALNMTNSNTIWLYKLTDYDAKTHEIVYYYI